MSEICIFDHTFWLKI